MAENKDVSSLLEQINLSDDKTVENLTPTEDVGITEEDLANPDLLFEKLENVDLTEEDTEQLLHEAYKVNMKLREMLRRQEEMDDIQMRRIHTAGALSGKQSTGSKQFATNKSPLPPISDEVTTRTAYSAYTSTRSPTHKNTLVKRAATPKRKKSGKVQKPEWDSRFSYS